MRTPAGTECPHFYGDYFRGRNREECRLLQRTAPDQTWTPDLCATCPVPDIVRANACEHQQLNARIHRSFPFLRRSVRVNPYCTKCACAVADPHIGCGQCHGDIEFLLGEPFDPDAAP
ncbi:MAG TPA: hypothetical protein VI451_05420 [Anaerolineales bacterium]|nr:hypothetical protein [Anaerolineales bacterium]